MAEVKDKPAGLASTNDLDKLPDDILSIPPAYLKLGTTPAALENPPAYGEVVTYCVRAKCKEEHGPLGRGDGEMRYERTMVVQAIWKLGDPEPPNAEDEQPALFGEDGEQNGWDYEQGEPVVDAD